MSALGALVYADWRGAINEARRVFRSPGRLALWFVYALGIGVFVLGRVAIGRRPTAATADLLTKADYLACTIVAGIVVLLAGGFGAAGIFRNRAEARFIIGSPVAAPLAIAYLHIRAVSGQGVRYVFSLITFFVVFAPRAIGANVAALDLAIVAGLFAASTALTVPRRLIAGLPSRICALAGIPLGLLALVPAFRDAAVQRSGLPVRALGAFAMLPAWHPGRILLQPHVGWFAATVGLSAIGIAVLAVAGRDAYPELYALSLARIERREGLRGRRPARADVAGARAVTRLGWGAPSGVAAFVWKSAVAFKRVAHPPLIAAAVVACMVGGFAVARVDRQFHGAFDTLTGGVIYLVVLAVGRSDALAAELALPLFWLSPAPMFERLAALAVARVWRSVIASELVAAGIAAGAGTLLHVSTFAIGIPALVTLAAGTNFAAFACFPRASDRIGPVVFLRFFISLALLVPPIVVYGVLADGFDLPGAALGAAALLALVEGGLLVGFAAGRLEGRADLLRG